MQPSSDQAVTLTESYRRSMVALRRRVGILAGRAWVHAGGDPEQWAVLAGQLAAAGRRQAAATVTGFHGHLLGHVPTIDLEAVLVLPLTRWDTPITDLATRISLSNTVAEAIQAATARAESAALADVTAAERQTAQLVDQTEPGIVGYRRCLSPRACRWCAQVAAQRYRSAESAGAPNHDGNCHCSVIPIVGDLDPGRTINRGLLEAVRSTDSAYVTADGEPADRPGATPQP